LGTRKTMSLMTTMMSLLLVVGCSQFAGTGGSGGRRADSASPNDSKPILTTRTADSLWSERQDPQAAEQALFFYRALAEQDVGSLHLWTQLSHAYYFKANYLEADPVRRDSLYLEGYNASQHILAQNPKYQQLLFNTGDEKMALRVLSADYLEVLYWGIANYGKWLATKGKLIRLGQRGLILATLEYINEQDPDFYYGAYERYLGALLCRDPLAEGDLERSRQVFEESIATFPDYLGTYGLMAMFYSRASNNRDQFYELLTRVVTAVPDPELPYAAENYFERKRAENLMIQAEREKWFEPRP